MSGVWTERSVPMTDHECAVEALEAGWRQRSWLAIKIISVFEVKVKNGAYAEDIMEGTRSELIAVLVVL